MGLATATYAITNPYVGLRSFEPNESALFHGRDSHTLQLLRLLAANRFVGVVGTSGSGKSSLVKAGLLPSLHRGYLRDSSSRWRTAVMRPGAKPMSSLAAAIAVLSDKPRSTLSSTLSRLERDSGGLVDVLRNSPFIANNLEHLLLVVDQFEEIFRVQRGCDRSETAAFVNTLLKAREQMDVPIFVVLTMRSEYLGKCSEFPDLIETLTQSLYLIPRLTREQREEAIRKPLEIVGGSIEEGLVQRLLNEVGDDPNQLPALQHALMNIYNTTPQGERLRLKNYRAEYRFGRSLDFHAERIFKELPESKRQWVEKVFRTLTVTEGGLEVRRPTRLGALYEIVNAKTTDDENGVLAVVETFAQRDNSLLFSSDQNFGRESLIDITHESLIEQWHRLKRWVRDEAQSADWFKRLLRSAELHEENPQNVGLWVNPDAEFVFQKKEKERWNQAWGDQYEQGFKTADEFLRLSREAIDKEKQDRERIIRDREKERQDRIKFEQSKRRTRSVFGLSLLLIGLSALFVWYFAWSRMEFARKAQELVEKEKLLRRTAQSALQTTRVNPQDGLRYVWIPPGGFVMGCSENDGNCPQSEVPAHQVEITASFWIGQTEVTQAAYYKVIQSKPSGKIDPNTPVQNVTWQEAKRYCELVGLNLPTEAQWEYAARAGTSESRYGNIYEIAWYEANAFSALHTVAARSPNAWGLYDTLGNVAEWVADWYSQDYNRAEPTDPKGPSKDSRDRRVVRGGSWKDIEADVRVSGRAAIKDTSGDNTIGFRCAGPLPN